jgi:hypothetical protein
MTGLVRHHHGRDALRLPFIVENRHLGLGIRLQIIDNFLPAQPFEPPQQAMAESNGHR